MGASDPGRLLELPTAAAWRHLGARQGHEVVFFTVGDGVVLDGTSTGTEDGVSWWVHFHLEMDSSWTTRRATIDGRSTWGSFRRELVGDGRGRWTVDGREAPELDGCVDVDLEASACTNTVPIHRLDLQRDEIVEAPAAFVRAEDLRVERLDQRYALGPDRTSGLGGDASWTIGYRAERFGVDLDLTLDRFGLVVGYPGLAERTA